MPSNDIDGSPIVIINRAEGVAIHALLILKPELTDAERSLLKKVVRDFELPSPSASSS